jgi:AGCS family alanine or glycine:cation symporter
MAALPEIWAMADMALGLMTVINITAIVMLTPTIVAISNDYFEKRRLGKDMAYKTGDCEMQGESENGIWDEK